VFAASHQKILAIGNAVQFALSSSRAKFETEKHRIEGEVNRQIGPAGNLSSGVAVHRFAIEIEAELRNRGQVAGEALGKAIDSQKLKVSRKTVKQLKVSIRKVWDEETQDLSGWYQKMVSVNNVTAIERPFESSAEAALQGVFVDIENKVLVPGFLAQLGNGILNLVIERLALVIVGIIIIVVLFILRELLL